MARKFDNKTLCTIEIFLPIVKINLQKQRSRPNKAKYRHHTLNSRSQTRARAHIHVINNSVSWIVAFVGAHMVEQYNYAYFSISSCIESGIMFLTLSTIYMNKWHVFMHNRL